MSGDYETLIFTLTVAEADAINNANRDPTTGELSRTIFATVIWSEIGRRARRRIVVMPCPVWYSEELRDRYMRAVTRGPMVRGYPETELVLL